MEYKTLISLHLPSSWRKALEDMARQENNRTLKRTTMSDMVRRALEQTYNFDTTEDVRSGEGGLGR